MAPPFPGIGVVDGGYRLHGRSETTHSIAHCLVGAPRVFIAPCVQRAYVSNLLGSFPPEWHQDTFAYFSMPGSEWHALQPRTRGEQSMIGDHASSPLAGGWAAAYAAHHAAKAVGAAAVVISAHSGRPSCMANDSVASLMMRNMRRCLDLVRSHEQSARAGRAYDFVTRIRPDAIFFAKMELPPQLGMDVAPVLLPLLGLGGKYGFTTNDHLVLVRRSLAPAVFEQVSLRLDNCSTGAAFRHGWDQHPPRRRSHEPLGHDSQSGFGWALKQVGVAWLAWPWPCKPHRPRAHTCKCAPISHASLAPPL